MLSLKNVVVGGGGQKGGAVLILLALPPAWKVKSWREEETQAESQGTEGVGRLTQDISGPAPATAHHTLSRLRDAAACWPMASLLDSWMGGEGRLGGRWGHS